MTGRTISHYRVLEKLGEGGMGVVYKAEDVKLRRVVALKFLPPRFAGDEESRQRFLHEARAAAGLSHSNICVIYEVDEENNFLAMEYLEGETVAASVKRRPLPIEEALEITIQAGEGLRAAHEKGMVHRDVKGSNLMRTAEGQVKVMDFGLAQMAGQTRITKTGSSLGTPAYMAPEQFRGEAADQRSDIWSLGVVLYEMVSGRLPFRGESEAALMYSVLGQEPEPLTALRAGVPVEIDRIVGKALAKDRAARYQHVADLLVDLKAVRKAPQTAMGSAASPRRRLGSKGWIAAALLLAVVYGASWVYRRQVRARQDRTLQEASRLFDAGQTTAAFKLARQLEAEIPGDPRLARLWNAISTSVSIGTEPAGAEVFVRDVLEPEWIGIGKTPLPSARVPFSNFCLRVSMNGYENVERVTWPFPVPLVMKLPRQGSSPEGMLLIPESTADQGGLPAAASFWLDNYEVTNRQFKRFVDAGGYREPKYWKQPFVENGRLLTFQQAMSKFADATGRPGPASWDLGSYPEGREDYPVSGVSWFEAAAYAEFAGKALPTVFHWRRAAFETRGSDLLLVSNFAGKGPAPTGKWPGMAAFGNHDMAGNVKEWCWNQTGDRRYILGGAWNEPSYMFTSSDAQSPFSRTEAMGFRCARYTTPPPPEAMDPVELKARDYSKEKPAAEEAFSIYRSLYSYDRGPLDPKVDRVDSSDPAWRLEKVSFNAAYGGERVLANLYLPKQATPPYQTVVHFPGSYALSMPSIDLPESLSIISFLIRSGRAVMFPVYKGTYERRGKDRPSGRHALRDEKIQWAKDLGRSIDYLETRKDIDRSKLAYFGYSLGAGEALPLLGVEQRLKTAVLMAGGFPATPRLPEEDAIHFVPRIRMPVLMVSGRNDFIFPYEASQLPLFRLLGTPPANKKHVVAESGHNVPRNVFIKETLLWLDQQLGPPPGAP